MINNVKRQRPPPTEAQRTQIRLFLDSGSLARLRINAETLLSSTSLASYPLSIKDRILVQDFVGLVRAVQSVNQYHMRHITRKK